jgi:hypothetical protein
MIEKIINWIISYWPIVTSIIGGIISIVLYINRRRNTWVKNNHANLRASIIKQSPNRIIRIYNPSEAEATNIRIEGLDIYGIYFNPVDFKFPSLKSKARFDIKITLYTCAPDNVDVTIFWDDRNGKNQKIIEILQLK